MQIFVIHFFPLEYYPPVFNFLNYLSTFDKLKNIHVFSLSPDKNVALYSNHKCKLSRFSYPNSHWLPNAIAQLKFFFTVLFSLLKYRPAKVIYFEYYSALPAIVYKLLFPGIKLFIHYHEIFTITERKKKLLSRIILFFEKKIYRKAYWISHTNKERIEIFKKEYRFFEDEKLHVIPNFPPQSWIDIKKRDKQTKTDEIKFVYIGAISMEIMYFREFLTWYQQYENFKLDIYSYKVPNELLEFIDNHHIKKVTFHGAVEYTSIPGVLSNFDVGLILYKGHITNIVNSEPNKFFEYYNCGLDVWFPKEIKGLYPHVTSNSYPKVIKLDFSLLHKYKPDLLISRTNFSFRMKSYTAEEALKPFVSEILNS